MTQQAILNIIAAVVLVAVVTLLENAVNLRRERRSQQVYYPAVAALYSVVMIVLALLFGGKTASVRGLAAKKRGSCSGEPLAHAWLCAGQGAGADHHVKSV